MSDWTAGYTADINYTFGYYPEMNPIRSRLAFANAGLLSPQFKTACELGFGQGVSVNFHAAATGTEWHGTDFNPAQAGFAQDMARVAGSGAQLRDEGFIDFVRRDDLPNFDFIGLHGIWSWITDENRAAIVNFIRRKLTVGGVVYISYNTQPGWAGFAPMRHLLTEHADSLGASGKGIVSRIDGAIEFAEKLLLTKPAYLRAYPQLAERLKKMKGQNRQYLAHEYFNREWQPMHFSEMIESLGAAKLSFACSASYIDHVPALNLSDAQQTFLREIPDGELRETVRDFIVNQQFRRDYWVKGARRLNSSERKEALQAQRVMLVTHRSDVALKINGSLGEATLTEDIYVPVLDTLADHQPRTLGQLAKQLQGKVGFSALIQAALVLMSGGQLVAAQDDASISKNKRQTDQLNAHLLEKARSSSEIGYLVSPVTGGGIALGRFQQLFLRARNQGSKLPTDWAQSAWKLIETQGEKIVKDGKPLANAEENQAELTRLAVEFSEKKLPLLQAMQIA